MYNISIKNFLPPPLVAGVARSWQSTIPEKTLVRVMGWGSSPCWRSQQPPSSPRSTTPSPILKVYIYILCLQWWPWFLTLKSPNIKKLLDLLDLDSLQSYCLAVAQRLGLTCAEGGLSWQDTQQLSTLHGLPRKLLPRSQPASFKEEEETQKIYIFARLPAS